MSPVSGWCRWPQLDRRKYLEGKNADFLIGCCSVISRFCSKCREFLKEKLGLGQEGKTSKEGLEYDFLSVVTHKKGIDLCARAGSSRPAESKEDFLEAETLREPLWDLQEAQWRPLSPAAAIYMPM